MVFMNPPLPEPFDPATYERIREGCQRSAKAVAPLLYEAAERPASVIDVGGGEGWWAAEFLGLPRVERATLMEAAFANRPIPIPDGVDYFEHDLTEQLAAFLNYGSYDLALCLEVAEHLPPASADVLVSTLTELSPVIAFSAAIPGQTGHGHLNCFPAGTVVSGPRARRSFSRRYEGPLIKLAFSSGKLLAATPNHPILTPQGWVAAGLLSKGCEVVRCETAERIPVGIPDEHQDPSLIQDVAATVGIAGCVSPRAVPIAAEDFDGDGIGSEVAVVRADSDLQSRSDSSIGEPIGQHGFTRGRVAAGTLVASRASDARRPSVSLTAPPRRGASCEPSVLLGSSPGGTLTVDRRSPSGRDLRGGEPTPDRRTANAEGGRQLLRRLAEFIAFDEVVATRVEASYRGDVFNLETDEGWYVADGIIVHNCQWPDYWTRKFQAEDYAVSGYLRRLIWSYPDVEPWYRQNLLLAVYQGAFDRVADLDAFYSDSPPAALVHPDIYAWKEDELARLRSRR